MNCREFIIEFEERGTLSEPATLHLTICADCQKLSERQTQIWLLIDGMKPIAAPPDFDFHVKSKIANAKPSDFQSPRFLPILRYVLPLSVVILLLGLFAFNSTYFSGAPSVPQLAQSKSEIPNSNAILPVNLSPANQLAFAPSNENTMPAVATSADEKSAETTRAANTPKQLKASLRVREIAGLPSNKNRKTPKANPEDDSGLGSSVGASTAPTTLLTPRGINPQATAENAPKIELPKQVGDEQFLTFFGIETALENGQRTVKALVKDKTGERSGIKVGDIIEKINTKSINVRRGDEKLEIILRNDVGEPR